MNDVEKIHYINRLLLAETKRICDKYRISFFLYAGTLIGSVREGDFIPWDDDADVGFLRSEYERFIQVAPGELKEGFELVLPGETKGFFDMIAKIVYTGSRLHDHCAEDDYYDGKYAHISLDLYTLDGAYDNRVAFAWQCFRLKTVYGMMMDKRPKTQWAKYNPLEFAQVVVLTIMGKPFRHEKLAKWYIAICTEAERKALKKAAKKGQGLKDLKGQVFASNSVLGKIGVRFERDWFKECSEGTLGADVYPIPVGYDLILKARYGDYMNPHREAGDVQHAVESQVYVDILDQ